MLRDVAHCTRPCAGETENGDAVFVRQSAAFTLLAVIDALGHGPKAAETSLRALSCLSEVAPEDDLLTIMNSLHGALHGLRGAAVTALLFRPTGLSGCAVGNVGMKAVGFHLDIPMSPGVVGGQVRKFRVVDLPRPVTGRLVLFSDGISSRFSLDGTLKKSPAEACKELLATHGKSSDDATLLIADL